MQKPESSSIPTTPGVYMYKNAQERVIYVGKARVLRKRVLSYFRETGLPAKTQAMLRHAVTLETLSTSTEKEALLLEASLIKKHRPHYNIVLRDDKQYILFKISVKHAFPRLEVVRSTRRDGARYFGPFTSSLAARETWKLLHKAFPLRRCTDKSMKNRTRACLYHFMGQCLAPCMGEVTAEDYAVGVRHVVEVLSGRSTALMKILKTHMLDASENLEFEKAAALRDQIRAIERTVEKQVAVLSSGIDMDVVGLHAAEKGMALGILFVRGGVLMDGRTYFWPALEFEDAPELLLSFLNQFYSEVMPPARIVLPWLPQTHTEDRHEPDTHNDDTHSDDTHAVTMLEQSFTDMRGGTVRITAPRSAEENRLVDMAATNAREEGRRASSAQEDAFEKKLAAALHLDSPPQRIECVDVSHTSGKQTRVGMVVFEDGKAHKSAYRQYIMPDNDGDDYGTLYAWVARRMDSGAPWPDLLLIDGGKGQLRSVQRALEDAGREGLFALAAIAKARDEQGHADRRAGNMADRIFLPNRTNPLPLREGSQELLFLQHIRDCTHRFALGSHRKARTGAALSSELMRLPGVGPRTARLLWDTFGSIDDMLKASEDDLAGIAGIGKARAKALWNKLQTLQTSTSA